MLGALLIYLFDKRGKRRCLALSDRPNHQKEPLLAEGKLLDDRRQIELGDGADDARNEPKCHTDAAPLEVSVAPEARLFTVCVRKIYFLRFYKAFFELWSEHSVEYPQHVFAGKHRLGGNWRHNTGDPRTRLYAGTQMQVARALGNGKLDKSFKFLFVILHNRNENYRSTSLAGAGSFSVDPSSLIASGAGTGAMAGTSSSSNSPPSVLTSSNGTTPLADLIIASSFIVTMPCERT